MLSLISAHLAPSKTEHVDLDVDYATTLVAAVLLGIGFVLQQYAARQEPESRFLSPRILTDLLRKPRWLVGIACMVAGQLLAACRSATSS